MDEQSMNPGLIQCLIKLYWLSQKKVSMTDISNPKENNHINRQAYKNLYQDKTRDNKIYMKKCCYHRHTTTISLYRDKYFKHKGFKMSHQLMLRWPQYIETRGENIIRPLALQKLGLYPIIMLCHPLPLTWVKRIKWHPATRLRIDAQCHLFIIWFF